MTSNIWKIWYINDKLTQMGHLNPIYCSLLPLYCYSCCLYKRRRADFRLRKKNWAQVKMRDQNAELYVTDIPARCVVTNVTAAKSARMQRRRSNESLKRHRRKRANVLCLKRSNSLHSNDGKFKFVKFSAVLYNFPFLI